MCASVIKFEALERMGWCAGGWNGASVCVKSATSVTQTERAQKRNQEFGGLVWLRISMICLLSLR